MHIINNYNFIRDVRAIVTSFIQRDAILRMHMIHTLKGLLFLIFLMRTSLIPHLAETESELFIEWVSDDIMEEGSVERQWRTDRFPI